MNELFQAQVRSTGYSAARRGAVHRVCQFSISHEKQRPFYPGPGTDDMKGGFALAFQSQASSTGHGARAADSIAEEDMGSKDVREGRCVGSVAAQTASPGC